MMLPNYLIKWVICYPGVVLHVFSDSSNEAYGGGVYFTNPTQQNHIKCATKCGAKHGYGASKLVIAKDKVAPIKRMT